MLIKPQAQAESQQRHRKKAPNTGFIDLAITGLDHDALQELEYYKAVTADSDGAHVVVHSNDVWLLGDHRLICGDSTNVETVNILLDKLNVDLCLTDPPYGLGDTKSDKNNYVGYEDTRDNLVCLIAKFLPIAQARAKCIVLTPGNMHHRLYPAPIWTMAWFTPAGVGCGPWGFCCWQPILCYGKDPKLSRGKGSYPDAVVHTETAEQNGHPCAKPIKFWCWLMERCSEREHTVYEPFCGSGTTIIAAEMTGRRCFAIELNPLYVYVSINRWQMHTGKLARLEETGETFTEVLLRRSKEPLPDLGRVIDANTDRPPIVEDGTLTRGPEEPLVDPRI